MKLSITVFLAALIVAVSAAPVEVEKRVRDA